MTSTTAPASAVDYEVVIGLEVHCQVLTRTKMFCACSADDTGAAENTHLCVVCLGMPGTMPVANREAVEKTIMTALALNCEIPAYAKFDRKNYHYPDLMKGYQISQYDLPFSQNGWLEVEASGQTTRVGITRVHLEEDTARLKHEEGFGDTFSLVDINRSGVPLMEIVSEPDMRSPEEAVAYLHKLRALVRAIGVSKANMEEGNFRCDANVSIRPRGTEALGVKVEIKNMNSFRSVQRALEYEIIRQTRAAGSGEPIMQETRGWVDTEARTVSQRSKEQAHDYRYFPEPDLPPFTLTRQWVESLRARLPELPDAMKARFMSDFSLSPYDAGLLTESAGRAAYFEQALGASRESRRAKTVANWILGDLARLQNAEGRDLDDSPIPAEQLGELVELVDAGTLTSTAAKTVFEAMYQTGKAPAVVVAELGLAAASDDSELTGVVERAIAANPKAAADFQAGKNAALQALMGAVMRETRGRYPADRVRDVLQQALGSD